MYIEMLDKNKRSGRHKVKMNSSDEIEINENIHMETQHFPAVPEDIIFEFTNGNNSNGLSNRKTIKSSLKQKIKLEDSQRLKTGTEFMHWKKSRVLPNDFDVDNELSDINNENQYSNIHSRTKLCDSDNTLTNKEINCIPTEELTLAKTFETYAQAVEKSSHFYEDSVTAHPEKENFSSNLEEESHNAMASMQMQKLDVKTQPSSFKKSKVLPVNEIKNMSTDEKLLYNLEMSYEILRNQAELKVAYGSGSHMSSSSEESKDFWEMRKIFPFTELGCRPWNFSLISVIVLGLSNFLLTFLLLQTETCSQPPDTAKLELKPGNANQLREYLKDDAKDPLTALNPCPPPTPYQKPSQEQLAPMDDAAPFSLDVRLGRWDSHRLYRMFDSVSVGSRFVELSESTTVCLATQSSIDKLHSLVQVVDQWTGTISVALYAAGDEEFEILQKYIEYMRRCYEPIRERVVFSLAVPRNRAPRQQPRYYPLPEFLDCQKPEGTLNQLAKSLPSEKTSWRIRNVYPQNHMRNLARKNCQTDYVFLTDVDIVPSTNLSQVLEEFLRADSCEKCAYVIPTYELDTRVHFPQNKSELVRLAKKGVARPFHQKVFIHSQFATNFTRWMLDASEDHKARENLKTGKAHVSHDVTFELLYEPFYVARDVVPAHDERFMGYGYTRNTQVYEMYMAGYKFKVLTPTFTVHWGLQTRKGRPAWRERQNRANRKHFEVFKKEIFARYTRDPLKMIKN